MRRIFEIVFASVLMLVAWPAAADQIVTLNYTRAAGGATVSQRYILVSDDDPAYTVPAPKATLLLFIGGNGLIGLADGQMSVNAANYMLRTRWHFAATGPFNVAVMDAASDFLDPVAYPEGLRGQRIYAPHTEDIERVIADLRGRFPDLPVVVVGTSRGTISAAQAATLPAPVGPDALVLTSPVTVAGAGGTAHTVFNVYLKAVSVPTLVTAHIADGCIVTPPAGAEHLADVLAMFSPKVKYTTFSGGIPALSENPCEALSEHGFFGIEPGTVANISKWIRKQLE